MLYLIEGSRNSGKTFISSLFALPKYKFPFTEWFGRLHYDDQNKETHDFALGKEIMLMDLNKKGFIPDSLCDRGMITVFVWAVLSGRISEQEATNQFDEIVKDGLFSNTKIVWVQGKNPDSSPRNKDYWDRKDQEVEKEKLLYKSLFHRLKSLDPSVEIYEIQNTFDDGVKEKIENLKYVWNIN